MRLGKARRFIVSAGVALLLFIFLRVSAPASLGEAPALILGTVAGEPGTTVSVPLYYRAAPGAALQSVQLELEFVSNSVKFAQAAKGLAAELRDFDMSVEANELPPDERNVARTRLRIDISVVDQSPSEALPEGLWAYLSFRVPPDAKSASITLVPISVSGQDLSRNAVRVAAEEGKIIVSIPDVPMVGCFFFTH